MPHILENPQTALNTPTDFLPLLGTDHLEFYVGNAKQSAHFYEHAFGFEMIGYAGPETGVKDRASYVLQQGKIRLVLTTSLVPTSEISEHVRRHGDGVKVMALWVDDARLAYAETLRRGAESAAEPKVLRDENGEVVGCALSNHLIYLFNPGLLWIWVAVLPEHRGRGLGAKIFDEMLTTLRGAVVPESLMSHAKENAPHTLEFLERRGFVMRQRFVPSCLRLERADFGQLPPLRARLQEQNIRIMSLTDFVETDPDHARKLWTLIVDIEKRLPTFTPITPATFDMFVQRVLESTQLCRRATHVAVAGDECVGFSGLRLIQGQTIRRQTGLTGVKMGYHRLGIATAM